MNIILSNCAIKNGNRGCVALSISTMSILDKLLNERGIPHTFFLPQSGYNEAGEHTVKAGNLQVRFTSIKNIASRSLTQRIKAIINKQEALEVKNTKDVYKNADYILDIGQGDSFADIYGEHRFNWIYGQYLMGMKYNKPYCILPQTIGPFKNSAIKEKALKGIRYSSCVMTRDSQSYDFVKGALPNKEVFEVIDVAFFMPYERKAFDDGYVHVGLNISSLLWNGVYTQDNQFGLKDDYQNLVRSIIEYFLSQNAVKLHLIPHVVSGERNIENDYAVSYDLFEEYNCPNLILAPLFLDPIAAKGYIAGMDFFIGARMHSTIAAFSSGVPVIPMAYSRKFNGLFIDTLHYNALVDLKMHTNPEVINIIRSAYSDRNNLKSLIKDRMLSTVESKRILLENNLIKFLNI